MPPGVVETAKVRLGLLHQVAEFAKDTTALRGDCVQEAFGWGLASPTGLENRQFDFREVFEFPLSFSVEAANRLDLVAEQLDPHGILGVGGKEIEDSPV